MSGDSAAADSSSVSASALPAVKSAAQIVARLERLPISGWHVRMRVIVGVATFFDAFDALAIASVLPVLAPMWKLKPTSIGFMISTGYIGQFLGAILFGWIAQRFGRKPAIMISTALFGLTSIACAFAWDYQSLLILRTIQGLGLGGEVPVAATYISELAKAKGRGRFVLLFELIFPVGILAAGFMGWWIVPTFGWQYIFLVGGIPALLTVALRWAVPESPRWLATRGRYADAEQALAFIERRVEASTGRKLAPPAPIVELPVKKSSWADLFGPIYRRRTLVIWLAWFATYFLTNGLSTWLPTVYRTFFHVPLATALRYGVTTSAFNLIGAGAVALLIDRVGRRWWFTFAFVGACLALLVLGIIGPSSVMRVLVFATMSYMCIASLSNGLYLYTPELYPTRSRALAVGAATAWLRLGSAAGPLIVGLLIQRGGLRPVFLGFAAMAAVAAVVLGFYAVETKGRVLEEVSP